MNKDNNRLTLYIMATVYEQVKKVKTMVGAKGMAELLSTMLKYYAYGGGEPKYNMIEEVYSGTVHTTNTKIHRLKVSLSDADLHTLNKLTVMWGVPSISKVANYIMWQLTQLEPGEYEGIARQVTYLVPGYGTWVELCTLVTEPTVLNGYERLLAHRIASNPIIAKAQEGISLPPRVLETQREVTKDTLIKDIIEAGVAALSDKI